ncbi:MAG: tetratricopeptide repeat protein [Spirochaetes bacterium]|nr:tetratricopeptide repeat protein [Spirochaetota bacterium]
MIKITKIILSVAVLTVFSTVRAGFLVDENPEPRKIKPVESQSVVKSIGFPADTALNITVTPVPGSPDSARISWDLSRGSSDTFIVGRSSSVINDTSAALNALSVRIISSSDKNYIIDKNLAPGQYYYVVLSKKLSADKKIELFPNENYTTNPLIVDDGKKPRMGSIPKINKLNASIAEGKNILLTWVPLNFGGVKYTVYRSNELLNTPEKVRAAEKVAELNDRDRFIDRNAVSGTFFYAVTTDDYSGNEDFSLIPDESFTTKGIKVLDNDDVGIVSSIKANVEERGYVKLSWLNIQNFAGSYEIYRSLQPVLSSDKLDSAEHIASLPSYEKTFYDKRSGAGSFYYAVLSKDKSGRLTKEFYAEYNCTVEPVIVPVAEDPVHVLVIKSEAKGTDVNITWKYSGTDYKDYLLFRSEVPITKKSDLLNASLVDSFDLRRNYYKDFNLPTGTYYYSLVSENYYLDKNFQLQNGVNVTSIPVEIKNDSSDLNYSIHSISAVRNDSASEIKLTWKISGSEGLSKYSIFRLSSHPKTKEELSSGTFLASVEVTSGTYSDKPDSQGRYYYAIVPEDYLKNDNVRFQKGINVTAVPVMFMKYKSSPVDEETEIEIEKKADPDIVNSDVKKRKKSSVDEENLYSYDSVDLILKNYFYKRKYNDAIKYLSALSSSGKPESAKALFFIGRCYVEKKEYYTALKYFLNKSVKSKMPKQAAFWQDYCIKKAKGK